MYNRNYGGFDYVRIHSELLTPVLNRKSLTLNPQLTVIRDRCTPFEKSNLHIINIWNFDFLQTENQNRKGGN